MYDIGSKVVDDQEMENEEGFILYYNFNRSAINPSDYSRLQIRNASTLIRVIDNDICKYTLLYLIALAKYQSIRVRLFCIFTKKRNSFRNP